MTSESTSFQIVKCDCGTFEAKVHGQCFYPVVCHCHSCVSCKRHITNDPNNHEGVPLSLYTPEQVEFIKPDLTRPEASSHFGFVKVGPNGRIPRIYTKCCNSHIMNVPGKNLIGFNRDYMYEQDGVTKHIIPDALHTHANSSFDPTKVPEPKHDGLGPIGSVLTKVVPTMIKINFPGAKTLTENQALFPDPSTMEVVDITW
mmetsp:Transcript_3598/g.7722  ORF Transcript_3598/g.7722 Transcript_3598/m.7722 type:complete len:201 (-) Transcript_3598:88-690(-)|eukprot:CAMPEP_0183313782 /NCGR_PEP_ID=MMETSP0160_2-20130417/46460_1 /TAXON_ID=2839 ORGANISM="Odontella Sinensis, Strain Grunow 1884" /NCGR_SAMPLE_ID=MMETSP0160_2 /ASSEMBLY_ACC=CAM_ASM_000250 /LENGTH=200 /DNA_ID=CAMNT_0025478937 /DNA_START=185 /DNA_END=787 /DNA_ORIENTATION=-